MRTHSLCIHTYTRACTGARARTHNTHAPIHIHTHTHTHTHTLTHPPSVSLRTKATLPFSFPSFVWRGCLGQALDVGDLEGVDAYLVQSLNALTDAKMDSASFEMVYGGEVTFTTTDSNGDTVELIPGGERVNVTFDNRHEYVDMVLSWRLHELDRQVAAMRRGLGCVVPLRLLQLFTWQQTEELVAGKPEVDLEDLKRHTEYRGFRYVCAYKRASVRASE